MATTMFAENYYAYQRFAPILDTMFQPQAADQTALNAIEAKLAEAADAFVARRCQDAIDAYHAAEALIYTHLDPGFPLGLIGAGAVLARDPGLFAPLLSASLEWMNLLPPQQPIVPVRPRIPVDPQLLGSTLHLDQTGLLSSALATVPARNAAADARLADAFSAQGNATAARFFADRATATDAAVAKLVSVQPAAPVSSASGPALANAQERVNMARLPPDGATIPLHPLGPLPAPLPIPASADRSFGVLISGEVHTFTWQAGTAPPLDEVRANYYQTRVGLTDLAGLMRPPVQPADVALDLPHAYYYIIPLGLADCHHSMGSYSTAETYYLQATAYQYLNSAIEAPFLWQRLATLYLDWGNALFRDDQPGAALPIFERVVTHDATTPATGPLYATVALKPGATPAQTVITNLRALIAGQTTITQLNVNPLLAAIIVDVYQQLVKIQAGLDYWGMPAHTVPIWTFDYLQGVAANFAQLAISAERDVINFWDRSDQAALTRQQLAESIDQATAEVQAAQLQAAAANATVTAYADGVQLAQQRAQDTQASATEYAQQSYFANLYQAESAQVSGGDNGDPTQLNTLADQFMAGQTISGSRGTIAAAVQLVSSRYDRQYEIDAMQRQATELALAQTQAQDEQAAAQATAAAAQANVTVAQLHASAAQQNLAAFDAQTFSPGVWHRMGDAMWRLYRRYFAMALRAARLMQQAYNFETDQDLHLIKGSYASDEVKGLLAADALMADIQTFTYNLVTSQTSKLQPVRQTISLAGQYAFAFETQFRKTGVMEFETRIDDFDAVYPGTYAGRVEAIEVEVDGIVPVSGVSGTLTNSGISAYRTPAARWIDSNASGLKYRIQPRDTLVLSDYAARQDLPLIPPDQRALRVFQGAGLASTWQLELPKAINDIDYGALTDVRLTFYYRTRFDPNLRDRVLQQLASRPGINSRQRGIPLRWVYPDAFFHLQDTGELTMRLRAADFRANEAKPILTAIAVGVVTDGTKSANGIAISLSTPTKPAAVGTTDSSGMIASTDAGSLWASLAAGSALGDYGITLTAAANPTWIQNGKLNLSPIVNIVLLLSYSFTARA